MTHLEQIARAKALLLQHGFKLSVDACGCCDSPHVRLTFQDEQVIGRDGDPLDYASFDMFDD